MPGWFRNFRSSNFPTSKSLAPKLEADISTYSFQADGNAATVSVRIYFRRLFEPIADRYGWDLGEVQMEEWVVTVD